MRAGAKAPRSIVLPWFAERYAQGADWRSLAYRIHDHLPYHRLQFFPRLAAFNIGWHEKPVRSIYGYAKLSVTCCATVPADQRFPKI